MRFWHTANMPKRLLLIFACLIAVVGASCGGGDDAAAEDSRVDDVVVFLEGDGTDGDGLELPAVETRCVAEALVAGLDSDLIDEVLAGTFDDDPPPGAEPVLLDALFGCVSLEQLMIGSMVAEGATQEEAECFAGAFDEGTMRAMISSELTGEDPDPAMEEELMSAMFEVIMTCGDFDE